MATAPPTMAAPRADGDDPEAPARALARARAAFARGARPTAAARIARLQAVIGMLRDERERFACAIAADFGGRPRTETMLAEVLPLLDAARFARRHLRGWMRPERRRVPLPFRPGRAAVEHVPLGVVGVMAPWNYPLFLLLGPAIDALAAGNRVVLKPSEATPLFAAAIARAVGARFDPAVLAVVTGGVAVARAFAAAPWDHLVFTGGTATGRAVARAASDHLVPLTLELGGKSPAIVADDYDLSRAARSIATGKFFNAGQTCVAPDHVLVGRDRADAFAEALLAEARRMHDPARGGVDLAAIGSDAHRDRLLRSIAEAERGGARARRAGPDGPGRRLAPVVVIDPPPGCALDAAEVFGPVLPVYGVDGLAGALAAVRARPRPLALYLFTRDRAVERAVLADTVSGGVAINGTILQCAIPDLPFGGIGPSGSGHWHGRDGFRRFSHARATWRPGAVSGFEALRPPYGRAMAALLRLALRG